MNEESNSFVQINETWGFDSDSLQWILRKHKGKGFKPTAKNPSPWGAVKFYPSLLRLAHALHEIMLRTSEYHSIADLQKNSDEISDLLRDKLGLRHFLKEVEK